MSWRLAAWSRAAFRKGAVVIRSVAGGEHGGGKATERRECILVHQKGIYSGMRQGTSWEERGSLEGRRILEKPGVRVSR